MTRQPRARPPGIRLRLFMTKPEIIIDNTSECLYNMHIQKERSMKLYVVIDPEQGEAVFISPSHKALKAFIGDLRKELIESGIAEAEGCCCVPYAIGP